MYYSKHVLCCRRDQRSQGIASSLAQNLLNDTYSTGLSTAYGVLSRTLQTSTAHMESLVRSGGRPQTGRRKAQRSRWPMKKPMWMRMRMRMLTAAVQRCGGGSCCGGGGGGDGSSAGSAGGADRGYGGGGFPLMQATPLILPSFPPQTLFATAMQSLPKYALQQCPDLLYGPLPCHAVRDLPKEINSLQHGCGQWRAAPRSDTRQIKWRQDHRLCLSLDRTSRARGLLEAHCTALRCAVLCCTTLCCTTSPGRLIAEEEQEGRHEEETPGPVRVEYTPRQNGNTGVFVQTPPPTIYRRSETHCCPHFKPPARGWKWREGRVHEAVCRRMNRGTSLRDTLGLVRRSLLGLRYCALHAVLDRPGTCSLHTM